ncbi:MAG: hypothetical protein ABI824_10620 [Acidobacteriota bacterium]
MKILLAFAIFGVTAFAADPRIIFSKSFPGSVPAYVKITLLQSGEATYQEAVDEEPEKFTVESASVATMFELAGKLDHFQRPIESGLKVAKTGDKLFRWEDGGASSEAKFNYSTDLDARALLDWFERIAESERMYADLERTIRFDRLGVDEVLVRITKMWDQKRFVSGNQFLPMLDRIAKNDSFLHMAREKAASLADGIRGLRANP